MAKKKIMYMGYTIEKFLDRYECREDGMWASANTIDGVKKLIARHVFYKQYAAWKKTGDPHCKEIADEAWLVIR